MCKNQIIKSRHNFEFHPSHRLTSSQRSTFPNLSIVFQFSSSSLGKMGPNRSPMAAVILILFTLFTLTLALDMSIISYDKTHADKSSWRGRGDDEVKIIYDQWRVKHGKLKNNIDEIENDKRFEIFKDNLRFIDEHNAENRTYKVGLNRFADLSNEEYRSRYLGTKIDPIGSMMARTKTRSNRYAPSVGDKLPKSVDWRDQGAVVQVKDQGSCGNFCFTPISCLTIVFVLLE